jgi:hypothetical protein
MSLVAQSGSLYIVKKCVGIEERTDLTSDSIPGYDVSPLFHPGSLLPILCTIGWMADLGSFLK